MRTILQQIAVCLVAFIGFGMVRAPLQKSILADEQEAGLLPPEKTEITLNNLDQQLSIIALGGMSSLIAAILHIDAFDDFLLSDWPHLERRYEQIVALAPHTPFYWENGSWHMAFNASSAYLENEKIPESERLAAYHAYIAKGREFLKRGIALNPKSTMLKRKLGDMYSDIYRTPDFSKAADAYRDAINTGINNAIVDRNEFYALARVPSRQQEALTLGYELFKEPYNRVPTLIGTIYALENKLHVPKSKRIPFCTLFPTDEIAKDILSIQLNNSMRFPIDGVREQLDRLEAAPSTRHE